MTEFASRRRRFLAPEVIQTSSMDCGPAALKSLLEGFGVQISYGRLREACQTDLDGTSIDTVEEVARQLGLNAEQVLVPADHVLLDEAHTIPAIAVMRGASGAAHFAVAWRAIGSLVQLMDPARGRLWITCRAFRDQLFVHTMNVSAEAWRKWAGSAEFLSPLQRRGRSVGMSRTETKALIEIATDDPSWRTLARLDASIRMTTSLVHAGAVPRRDASTFVRAQLQGDRDASIGSSIPDHYWSVRPHASAGSQDDTLAMRGVVVVRASRLTEPAQTATGASTLSPELAAAVSEPPAHPLRHIWTALSAGGVLSPATAAVAAALAVIGVVVEALLLRGVLDIGLDLRTPEQRLWAGVVLTIFSAVLLGLEFILAVTERRLGNQLECRFRIKFAEKIPRLEEAYFQSRPSSDMAERGHAVHALRLAPRLGVRLLRVSLELALTAAALAWLNPPTAVLAVGFAIAAAVIPLLGHATTAERDLRARTHAGALVRFHLDALRGRTAIQAHSADAALEQEHETLLQEWSRSAVSSHRASVTVEGAQMLLGVLAIGWIMLSGAAAQANSGALLQVYWLLNLPALGYELALIGREYPTHRSTILRLLEPLNAPSFQPLNDLRTDTAGENHDRVEGARISLGKVSVKAAGHLILDEIDASIAPGEHVAIIGSSGAGKSTLIGLLLGFHRPTHGTVLVDDVPLNSERVDALRRGTAWVDPSVHIWNRSLLENLLFGRDPGHLPDIGPAMEAAGLLPVLEKLPQGLATRLGENGALLSAGEAQRVRLGRALLQPRPRLVLLDEPFLGLERDRRRTLLKHIRLHWSGSTLLYVTHDTAEARGFERVLVLEHGQIVEDGDPLQLAQMPTSRYRRMLMAQDAVQARLAKSADWKRLRIEAGRVVQDHVRANEHTA